MNDLRLKAQELYKLTLFAQTAAKKLTTSQEKDLVTYLQKIHLTKLDDTKDMRGCIYTKCTGAVCKKLENLLDY